MPPRLSEIEEEDDPDNDDESSIRGTRTLEDIYARCNAVTLEPTMHVEAANKAGWRAAMQEKIAMIEKNGTWKLIDKPLNQKVLGVKWVYRTKLNLDGSINNF